MFWNKSTPIIQARVAAFAEDDRTPIAVAARFVDVVLGRGAECTSSVDLVAAYDAARLLTSASGRADRDRWMDACDRIHTWLAVRCVCGEPVAVAFFNDRDDRVSTWSAA
jgi:hypothetical protein